MELIILPAAFLLDMVFGDPVRLPHPVVLMGVCINQGERFLRKIFPYKKAPSSLIFAGGVLVVVIGGLSFLVPFFILHLAYKASFIFGLVVEVIFCYQILAIKSMRDEAMQVYSALKNGDILKARKCLGRIVGRDTDNLDESQIIKATVETVSENTCDGVVAPLFFIVLGGAPLGFLYKAVSTMDSMIGYKNDKYKYFGFIGAKFDDVLNFIPARITGLLFVAGAMVLGYDWRSSFKIFRRDRLNHASPNSAHGEAAAAGALGISLGGGSFYFGEFIPKPTMGDALREPVKGDIIKTLRMFYTVSFFAFLLFWVIQIMFFIIFGRLVL